MFEGGCDASGKESFGTDLCVMTEENIPKFFVELGQRITEEKTVYADWIKGHREDLAALAEEFAK